MPGWLSWISTGLIAAVLLVVLAFAGALNAYVWLSPFGANHISDGIQVFNFFALLFAGIAAGGGAVLAVRREMGLGRTAAVLLWVLLASASFSAFCAYMYPRNGVLAPYEMWLKAGMPDCPYPWEAQFWRPLTGG